MLLVCFRWRPSLGELARFGQGPDSSVKGKRVVPGSVSSGRLLCDTQLQMAIFSSWQRQQRSPGPRVQPGTEIEIEVSAELQDNKMISTVLFSKSNFNRIDCNKNRWPFTMLEKARSPEGFLLQTVFLCDCVKGDFSSSSSVGQQQTSLEEIPLAAGLCPHHSCLSRRTSPVSAFTVGRNN